MKIRASAFLYASVLVSLPLSAVAQTQPVTLEAESGTVGSAYSTGTLDGAAYITIINDSPGFGPPATADGAALYTVTFPSAGNYELYARFRVGPGGGNDDSFFIGDGFGNKVGTTQWINVNQVDGGGYTAPDDTVRNGGPATTEVFKWFKVTGFAGPAVWTVMDGNLTQTFSAAGRENGNFLDKFAFGRQGSWYTVSNLDNGTAATGTPPPPPPPPYTPPGPPMATGKDKFVGSAHSAAQNRNFTAYWNQVTPENGGKWGTVEGTRDVMNWTEAHAAYDLARANGFKFKWHALVWGNQQPAWIENLPPQEQLQEIEEWFAAIAAEFPDLEQIDVVNEPLHDPPCSPGSGGGNYCNALGGAGITGWDWVIKAFELARQYFPHAQLLLNDYSITNDGNATTQYLEIIKLLQDRGLIDAIGDQGHAFSTTEPAPMPNHRANLDRLAATGLPIYITELDIDGNDDAVQLASYQRIFPVFWEHPAVKGITLWGFNRGHWRTAQGAWLAYDNGAERPALQWLQAYVKNTPAVLNAGQHFNVNENSANGTSAGTVVATDVDAGTILSGWQIDGGTGVAVFAIDGATGAITVVDGAALDFESTTSYTVNVSVHDGYRRSAPQAVTIRLTNANDNTPVVTAGQSFAVDGGTHNVLGKAGAIDADDSNQPGFTIFQGWKAVGGTGASQFAIAPDTGAIRAARATAIDFRKSSYSLVLTTSDGLNGSAQQSLTITIPSRVKTCLYGVDVTVPKQTAPLLLLLGGTLGTCRAP
jgi:endo-1,4-beta-xylanase